MTLFTFTFAAQAKIISTHKVRPKMVYHINDPCAIHTSTVRLYKK